MTNDQEASRHCKFAAVSGLPGGAAVWLSAIVNSADDAILGKSLSGEIVSWNPAAERLFGYRADEILGRPDLLLADPASPNETAALTERAMHGEYITGYETTRRHKNGSIIPVSITLSLVWNDAGDVIGSSKIVRDITAKKQNEDYIRLLTADLKHRTKNLLTVSMAYIRQTQCDTVSEFREAITGRISALANANAALSRTNWRHAKLEELIRDGVTQFVSHKDAIVLRGPDVSIGADAAQTWAIMVYELATNSLKYGALGHDNGMIDIVWHLEEQGLSFRWCETGGPTVEPPTREGLGFRVIRSGIESQLGGTLRLDWAPAGFACEVVLPAAHVISESR